MPKRFTTSEALTFGWSQIKKNPGFVLGAAAAFFGLALIPAILSNILFHPKSLGGILFSLLGNCYLLVLGMLATKIALEICDKGTFDLSVLEATLPLSLKYVGSKLLYGVVVFAGFLMLIVPGLIWTYKYVLTGYLVVDKGLGPVAALKRSGELTAGVKWDLFIFSAILGLVNFLGLLCLIVGLVVTVPLTFLSFAYVYRKIS